MLSKQPLLLHQHHGNHPLHNIMIIIKTKPPHTFMELLRKSLCESGNVLGQGNFSRKGEVKHFSELSFQFLCTCQQSPWPLWCCSHPSSSHMSCALIVLAWSDLAIKKNVKKIWKKIFKQNEKGFRKEPKKPAQLLATKASADGKSANKVNHARVLTRYKIYHKI